MRFLSVADRELRSAARQKATYRLRWLTAGAFLVLLLWMMWLFNNVGGQRAGKSVLHGMSIMTFFYCLLVGTARTADCISWEKREGTLGLLFLTNLNSAEIVAGKLCSSALAGVYGLIAIFPMLAITLLMGGVMFTEFWKIVLALVNAVFFAVSAGMVASVLCRKQFQAISVALGLALIFGAALFGVSEAMRSARWPSVLADGVALFSPLNTLVLSDSPRRVMGFSGYWLSLGVVASLSWCWLGLVTWRLSRIWRDRPERRYRWQRFQFWRRWRARRGRSHVALRQRLLGLNPYFWLASRQRVSAPVFMVLMIIVVTLTVHVSAPYCRWLLGGSTSALEAYVFAWMWTGMLIHGLVTYYAALVASQQLAEDKQAGALELILSTPATERAISRGLWLAYGRRMAFPMLVAVLSHLYFIWTGANMLVYAVDANVPEGVSPGRLLWSALWNLPASGNGLEWHFGFVFRLLLLILVQLFVVWVTLGWLGRWLGLRMKHPGFAPILSLGLVFIPPVLLYSCLCYLADKLNLDRLPERQFLPLMLWIAVGLALGHCFGLSVWARGRLLRKFRPTVTRRFQPPSLRPWWRPSLRGVIRFTVRFAGVGVSLVVLGISYSSCQSWRSRRAWVAFQQELKQRGESIELSDLLPEAVPADENFAANAAFRSFLYPDYSGTNYPVAVYSRLAHLDQNSYGGATGSIDWVSRKPARFGMFLGWFRGGPAPGETNREALAAQVLEVLKPFAPSLRSVEEASHLRFFQVTTNRNSQAVFQGNRAALSHLERLQFLFQLRASARLAQGHAQEAGEDVVTSLRLAALGRQSLDPKAVTRVQYMMVRSLQPVWDGLATHSWNERQLRSFQAQLESFDLLADYTNAVDRVVRAYIALWREIPAHPETRQAVMQMTSPQVGSAPPLWTAGTWWFDSCMQLHQLARNVIEEVDVPAGRILDHRYFDTSGLRLDWGTYQLLQQQYWYTASAENLAFVQNAVNQAVLACALERYWLAQGEYPESLAQLVPDWLDAIPHDVVNGRAMIYLRDDQGRYQLRGVGPNNQDDHQNQSSDDWLWAYPTPTGNRSVNGPGSTDR